MSADDGHRECPDCLGAVHVLEDVDNPCSAAVDLSKGERLRCANQVRRRAGRRGDTHPASRPDPVSVGIRTRADIRKIGSHGGQVVLAAVVNHVRTLEVSPQGWRHQRAVSSLMSRVLSAAYILGLQPPTPDPVP
ncbi:unnamed protein product [Arctogadus glacialis]